MYNGNPKDGGMDWLGVHPRDRPARRDSGVDVNNTHLSMINPYYYMMPTISLFIYQYSAS